MKKHLILSVGYGMLTILTPGHSRGAERQFLQGHVPAVVSKLTPSGSLPASNTLALAIGLPLRNANELTALVKEIYDPASPQYRQYLTPDQFAARFGPTEQDYQAVRAYAEANGLKVTATHPNRMVLDVRATVGDIEKALHVNLRLYPTRKKPAHFTRRMPNPRLIWPCRCCTSAVWTTWFCLGRCT